MNEPEQASAVLMDGADRSRFAVAALESFVAAVYRALGVRTVHAQIGARALVAAHLRGFESHGLACLAGYVRCLKEGRFNARPHIRLRRRTPWAAILDGDNGLGHVAAHRAMRAAISAARDFGIGIVGVRRSNHIGAAGVYPLMAAAEGMIGVTMANSAPSVAPFGSRQPFLGTSPLAVAVPAGAHPPFVLDMATAAAARRKIFEAAEANRPIPAGWALGADGQPTTNAAAAMKGVSLPVGGAKGSAMAMLVDVLAGALTGAEFAGRVLSTVTNTERPSASGNLHVALRVDAFMAPDEFARRMETLAARVEALPPAPGFDETRLPGVRGARLEAELRSHGVPLPAALAAGLAKLGAGLGVGFPPRLA